MKIKIVIPFFAVFLLVLMGCTQDEVIKEDTSVGGKEKISVTVTQGGTITRISHEEDGANGLILKWTANDAFKLYGTTKIGRASLGKECSCAGRWRGGAGD